MTLIDMTQSAGYIEFTKAVPLIDVHLAMKAAEERGATFDALDPDTWEYLPRDTFRLHTTNGASIATQGSPPRDQSR